MMVGGDDKPPLNELAHFGVKGMKWGVRHDGPAGVSSRTNREARKDAHEFVRAKMFYGESAGTRRKLIKATVEGKSNKDPNYKRAFDHHVAKQDTSKHAEKARGERKRRNAKNTTLKTGRGISHLIRGNPQYASALAATLFGGAVYAHKAGIDKMVLDKGKKLYRDISGKNTIRAGMSASEFLRNMGVG